MIDLIIGVGNENSLFFMLRKEWDCCYCSGELLLFIVVELDEYCEIIVDYGKVVFDECFKNVVDILECIILCLVDLIMCYGDKVFGVVLFVMDVVGVGYLVLEVFVVVIRYLFDFGVVKIQVLVSIGVVCVLFCQFELYKDLLMVVEGVVYVV